MSAPIRPDPKKHLAYVEQTVALFLEHYFNVEVNRKWGLVIKNASSTNDNWSNLKRQECADLARLQKPLLLRAQYEGKNDELRTRITLVWRQLASLQPVYEEPYKKRVTWLRDDIFIDTIYLPTTDTINSYTYTPLVELCTLREIEIPSAQFTLKRLITCWCRLRRNHNAEDITEAMLMQELEVVQSLRDKFKNNRIEEQKRNVKRFARSDPAAAINYIKSLPSQNDSLPSNDMEVCWEALQAYATRFQNTFHRHLFSIEQTNSIPRAAALMNKGKKTHAQAKALDYHLRLLSACFGHSTLKHRVDFIAFIKKTELSNSKLEKLLTALLPNKKERQSQYIVFVHDIQTALKMLEGLRPTMYFSDLMNAARDRTVNSLTPKLRMIKDTESSILDKVFAAPYPKSLREAQTRIQKITHAPLLKKLHQRIQEHPYIDSERMAAVAIRNGVLKPYTALLAEKWDTVKQSMPCLLKQTVLRDRINIEISNMTVPDGWLAMSLPEICIQFGGYDHLTHFTCDGGYLCIYFNDELIISGMLADAGDYILLNNLQGHLPTRFNNTRDRQTVCLGIQDVTRKLPKTVVMKDLSFNSLSIPKALGLSSKMLDLDLPNVRLDCENYGQFYLLT